MLARLTHRFKPINASTGRIGLRPTFYLAYLLFYFIPWLFLTPSRIDVLIAILAVGVFLPIHYRSFGGQTRQNLVLIALIEGIMCICAPFNGSNGVFHIYAGAQTAYQRPAGFSAVLFLAMTVFYAAISYGFGRPPYEIAFTGFIAVMVWGACLADAQRAMENEALTRERELEKQQSSIVERERIARDLHDLLGHTLTMVALKSDLAARLIDSNPEKAKAEILDIQKTSRTALRDVRSVVSGMLTTTVSKELENAKHALAAAGVTLTITGSAPAQSREKDNVTALFIREAVTNIIRHSGADTAMIKFESGASDHGVHIDDNGSQNNVTEGFGLTSLRARVQSIGGRTLIDSSDGVRISILLPKSAAL